jgi:hypothetical protein
VPRDLLKGRIILGAEQDGSREFISILATICADGSKLSPAIIYAAESEDIRTNWIEDFDPETSSAFFSVSKNGWSSDEHGLAWLKDVFDRETKAKAGTEWRLLILDGHHSHINLEFLDHADRNRILIAVLPPHTTHRLQPLDIGIFGPLAKSYSKIEDRWLRGPGQNKRMQKSDFWQLFEPAWEQAASTKNILSAFEATGIWPINPSKLPQS